LATGHHVASKLLCPLIRRTQVDLPGTACTWQVSTTTITDGISRPQTFLLDVCTSGFPLPLCQKQPLSDTPYRHQFLYPEISMPQKHDDQIETIRKMINKISYGFMVTAESQDGALHGRPMATAEVEVGMQSLWFATQRDSGKVEELASDSRVFVGYGSAGGQDWVALTGTGRVVDDREKINELWSPIWKNWFEGPDDPNLVLIEVTPQVAEYWDGNNKIIAMLKLAFTAVTGKKTSDGDHGKVAV